MALLIKTSGRQKRVTPADGKKFRLTEIEECLGGYVRRIMWPGKHVFVSDQGGLPANPRATGRWREKLKFHGFELTAEELKGEVLICEWSEV